MVLSTTEKLSLGLTGVGSLWRAHRYRGKPPKVGKRALALRLGAGGVALATLGAVEEAREKREIAAAAASLAVATLAAHLIVGDRDKLSPQRALCLASFEFSLAAGNIALARWERRRHVSPAKTKDPTPTAAQVNRENGTGDIIDRDTTSKLSLPPEL